MYDSSNSKRLSSSAPENISLSSTHFDQDQEEQLSIQKEEKVKSASLGKPEDPVSQTRWSDLAEQKLSCLKRKIAPHQVPTTMMMMMMNMIMKSSCQNFKNS
jgi:hypothetical protein